MGGESVKKIYRVLGVVIMFSNCNLEALLFRGQKSIVMPPMVNDERFNTPINKAVFQTLLDRCLNAKEIHFLLVEVLHILHCISRDCFEDGNLKKIGDVFGSKIFLESPWFSTEECRRVFEIDKRIPLQEVGAEVARLLSDYILQLYFVYTLLAQLDFYNNADCKKDCKIFNQIEKEKLFQARYECGIMSSLFGISSKKTVFEELDLLVSMASQKGCNPEQWNNFSHLRDYIIPIKRPALIKAIDYYFQNNPVNGENGMVIL